VGYWEVQHPLVFSILPLERLLHCAGVNQEYGGLMRNIPGSGLDGMSYAELEALQQAMALSQEYSQTDRPPDAHMQHWRPDAASYCPCPLAGSKFILVKEFTYSFVSFFAAAGRRCFCVSLSPKGKTGAPNPTQVSVFRSVHCASRHV